MTTTALETLLFRARRSLAEELEHQLTCTEAQLAVSRSVDGRLGRKERRRLRDHLDGVPGLRAVRARSSSDTGQRLRGLMLIPIPLSLSLFKGLEGAGTATAATMPTAMASVPPRSARASEPARAPWQQPVAVQSSAAWRSRPPQSWQRSVLQAALP